MVKAFRHLDPEGPGPSTDECEDCGVKGVMLREAEDGHSYCQQCFYGNSRDLRDDDDEFFELLADKARIDWLEDKKQLIGNVSLPNICIDSNPTDLRKAIDQGMQMDKEIKDSKQNETKESDSPKGGE